MHKKTFCLAPGSACHHTFSPSVSSFSRDLLVFYKSVGITLTPFEVHPPFYRGQMCTWCIMQNQPSIWNWNQCMSRRKALMRLSHGCNVWFHGAKNALIIHLLQWQPVTMWWTQKEGWAVIYHGMLFTHPISRLLVVLSPGVALRTYRCCPAGAEPI